MKIAQIVSPHRTRRAAIDAGSRRYYTGRPCKWGHLAERYTSTNGCMDCVNPTRGMLPVADPNKSPTVVLTLAVSSRRADGTRRTVTHEFKRQLQIWVIAHLADACTAADAAVLMAPPAKLVATDKCNGTPLDEFRRAGWIDEKLLEHGYAVGA